MSVLTVQERCNKVLVLIGIIHLVYSQSGILKKKDCSLGKSSHC